MMQQHVHAREAYTLTCPHCGGTMRVAAEHVAVPVACPHCRQPLEPSRLLSPPPPPPVHGASGGALGGPPRPGEMVSWRNRWVAGALGILLGAFGVHRFYLGYTGIGLLQILVTVLTFGTVGSIWGFIEGILCFCGAMRDADGLPLQG